MPQYKHIIINEPGQERNYTKPPGGGGEFLTPPRDRRVHARNLLDNISQATADAQRQAEETGHVIHDICLEIIGESDFDLKVESLEYLRSGIEVRSVKNCTFQKIDY